MSSIDQQSFTGRVKPIGPCAECGKTSAEADFYVSNKTYCKDCLKARVRANRESKVNYYRSYDRARYRLVDERKEAAKRAAYLPSNVEARKRATKAQRAKQKEKFMARNAVANALRDGRLTRGDQCYFCGAGDKLQAHHHDYSKPFDVFWLCPSCHGKLHTINGDFQRTGTSPP